MKRIICEMYRLYMCEVLFLYPCENISNCKGFYLHVNTQKAPGSTLNHNIKNLIYLNISRRCRSHMMFPFNYLALSEAVKGRRRNVCQRELSSHS